MSGILYIVATPIGNLGDLTTRAVKTLAQVDRIYAEDTRVTLKLLAHLGLNKPLSSLHEHNEADRVAQLQAQLEQGLNLALVSDAGTPLISDPGYRLVHELTQAGYQVVPIPGVSAVIAALSAAGLPTDRFCFEGFLPAKASARRAALQALAREERTLVLYESSHRIVDLLHDALAVLGEDRPIVVARELSKLYEQFYRGSLVQLYERIQTDTDMQRGEFVVMIAGVAPAASTHAELDPEQLMQVLLEEGLPVRQVAKIAARLSGQSKNQLYRQALGLAGGSESEACA